MRAQRVFVQVGSIPIHHVVPRLYQKNAAGAISNLRIHSALTILGAGPDMENRDEQSHADSAGRNSPPLASILDAVRHPWDANSILDRAIAVWDHDPTRDVLVILPLGEAKPMENRLRVKLAAVRKELKKSGVSAIKQFGFETQIMKWTLEDGTEQECLILGHVVYARHTVSEAFDAFFGEKKP